MEIELNRFTPAEQATFRLRALYEQAGYRKYRASRFEEYALYQEYQRFLPDAQVITFTDLDGKLRAIKPDVTLSIAKTAQPAAGECKRFYYNEEVCRPSRESHTFQSIHQMGLETSRPPWCGWPCKAWPRWMCPPCWKSATWAT